MEMSNETPIACSSCAKAKAKCDKKVPCTRCANKRIHCQPRHARRSGDHSNANRQHDVSRTFPPPQFGNTAENSMPWGSAPFTVNPYSVASAFGSHQPQKFQRRGTNEQAYSFDAMNDLTPISPSTRFSMASTLQSFGDMEGLLEEGDCSPSDQGLDGSNPSLLATGLQTPIDFSIPLEPSLLNSTDFASHDLGPSAAIDIAEIDLRSPKSSPPSRRGTLYSSPDTWVHQTSVQEQDVVVVAREGWSYFKCNPTSARSACPKTAKFHLEGLEQTLRSREAWQHLELLPDFVKPTPNRNVIYTEPFSSFTRDKLLAITQTFLHEASNIHYAKNSATQTVAPTEGRGFIILPPANILEHFLDAYVWRFEPYYPFVNAALLDANNLMRIGDARAASLLLLLMIALGASATPTMEARFLTNGLTEACRISLLDNIEKNSELVEDLTILRCGLLFTTAAVWSGDKWHMDIGMGQRAMYMAMLDHAGLLDFQDRRLPMSECQSDPESAWTRWKVHESRSRLVASWVLVDQEDSLFMDVAPVLSISNLMTIMPDMDVLWRARTSSEWLEAYERANGASYKPRMTLCDLFRFFLDGGLCNTNVQLSPIQLRLLLHPLQSLTIHLRQLLRYFPEGASNRKGSQTINKTALRSRFEEVQSLLKQWYALARRCPGGVDDCSATFANLVNYHLISLNTIVCVPDIEQFASSEVGSEPLRPSSWLQASCTEHTEENFFHCGQVLRLLRLIPENVRPPWWPAAVYRAAVIAWMTSMANAKTRNLLSSLSRKANQPFPLDNLDAEHPTLTRYLGSGEGQPMFTKRDGTMLSLEEPQSILTHCVEMLRDGQTTSFSEGIQSKLTRLAERWAPWKCE